MCQIRDEGVIPAAAADQRPARDDQLVKPRPTSAKPLANRLTAQKERIATIAAIGARIAAGGQRVRLWIGTACHLL